jgi:hypothetical protein
MYFIAMPMFVVEENVFFSKFYFMDGSIDKLFNSYWIKDNTKRIGAVLKLKIRQLCSHIFSKTRT